ncbi:hypothetical protein AcV7_000537 [Taiwanofungus camphoratus]|nr:hypothetical protein AcV7_000537 [Antrodia cinnamomea]
MPSDPPPVYSPETPHDQLPSHNEATAVEPQILIIPTGNDASFQKGYLGADGERAAIEGELQLKCAESFRYDKVTVSLRTVETAYEAEIELGHSEVLLSSLSTQASRSSFPFSIPLPPDTPQCIHTSQSSLVHTLTANVYALGNGSPVLSRSLTVHTRRYTSHPYISNTAPEVRVLDEPTRIEFQVPRTTFRNGEPLPIYITVPAPRRELVLEQGLRLRNIRAEMVRFVKVRKEDDGNVNFGSDFDFELLSEASEHPSGDAPSSSVAQKRDVQPSSSSGGLNFRPSTGVHGEQKVIALSGASCRLHPTRPIRIRLVLRPPIDDPPVLQTQDLPTEDYYSPDSVQCASISQTTLLHSVSFRLRVHVAFMNMTSRTERVSTLSIPIVVLPPTAPLPELEESMDSAYHKKHDRPPIRTIRADDADVPRYEEGEAGPSYLGGAPPPFEEREAPPPFFSTEPEASTSSRLPTFQESEREIYVPSHEDSSTEALPLPASELFLEGEGTLFGFPASEQFDGYTDDTDRSFTPPPTVEMATRDTDVTGLANLDANVAMEALGRALGLEPLQEVADDGPPPPPPPPMDDPSDPPPSIDSDFRSPQGSHHGPSSHLHSHPHGPPGLQFTEPAGHHLDSPDSLGGSHGHAPPPYRVPDSEVVHEHIVRPPPYMDLIPRSQ